jgi:hypothetical protein
MVDEFEIYLSFSLSSLQKNQNPSCTGEWVCSNTPSVFMDNSEYHLFLLNCFLSKKNYLNEDPQGSNLKSVYMSTHFYLSL